MLDAVIHSTYSNILYKFKTDTKYTKVANKCRES